MKQSLYAFFLPSSIPNRKAAASAVAAGAVAGALLTVVMGVACVLGRASAPLLAGTVILGVVTIGIWKRILSAAVIGLLVGMGLMVWTVLRGEVVTALLLTIPVVGGFLTAVRGIAVLKDRGGRS